MLEVIDSYHGKFLVSRWKQGNIFTTACFEKSWTNKQIGLRMLKSLPLNKSKPMNDAIMANSSGIEWWESADLQISAAFPNSYRMFSEKKSTKVWTELKILLAESDLGTTWIWPKHRETILIPQKTVKTFKLKASPSTRKWGNPLTFDHVFYPSPFSHVSKKAVISQVKIRRVLDVV